MLSDVQVETTVAALRRTLADHRSAGRSVGFVPTMGALHQGHVSLMERARSECDIVVLSIFVNPLQFNAAADLERYPRPFERDSEIAQAAGTDLLFAPTVEEMYPVGRFLTSVHVSEITEPLEGAARPGHFDGVATVVAKLFGIVGPCRAYFGEKDWQQLAVVRRLAQDLSLPVDVVGCPIVRDPDGLALSSRNVQLTSVDRAAALSLPMALIRGYELIEAGCRDPRDVQQVMFRTLQTTDGVQPDYAEVVDSTLRTPQVLDGELRLLVAAQVGTPRLIDNMGVTV